MKTFEVERIIHGRMPMVQFQNMRYSARTLAKQKHLLGQRVILTIDPKDVRTLKAHLKTGQDLGVLELTSFRPTHAITLDQVKLAQRCLHEGKHLRKRIIQRDILVNLDTSETRPDRKKHSR